ncbi:uncharacterized protein [Blastocystis hominis]|uniref:Uncharacterized protein n=1 Tax=Blastocystis hominis TaxID=12968 RepID=D8MA49_BLAHO|nr:uncharacterized protein [Blastocystis hominis]CBK24938.2 unnamed protein product [Blastocystis hominis]|eukprot:XP_012898986.1 uncharacterized protein [Blastocystis hominis]
MITRSIAKSFPIDHYALVQQEPIIIIHFTISKWNSQLVFCQYQSFKSTSMIQIHDSFYYFYGLFFTVRNITNLMISKHFQHFLLIEDKSLIHEYSIIEYEIHPFGFISLFTHPCRFSMTE